jgi:hypothetical protein
MRRILLSFADDDDVEPTLIIDGEAQIAGIFLPSDGAATIRLTPVRRANGNMAGLRVRLKTSGTA